MERGLPLGPRRSDLRVLALIFGVAALATVIATAPASLVSGLATSALGGRVSVAGAEGSLWRGRVLAVAVDGVLIGDVAYKLSPLGLFLGGADMEFSVGNGAASGAGRARLSLSGRDIEVHEARIDFNLAAIRKYTLFGAPYSGAVKAEIEHLKLTRLGCAVADARIETTALSRLSQQTIGEVLALAGPASCADRALSLSLAGEASAGRADIGVVISPDLTYELSAAVKPERSELRMALQLIGFEMRGEVMSFDVRGELKGMKS